MVADQNEHNALWRHEGEMRHRTAGLTRMEKAHLSNMNSTLCQQLEASLQMQGGPPVAAVWLQALLTTEQPEYVVGELILCPGAAWTLAKCQLLEKRTGPDSRPGDIRAAACQPQLSWHWAVGAEGMALAGLVLQTAPGALFAQGATSFVELLAGRRTCAHAGWLRLLTLNLACIVEGVCFLLSAPSLLYFFDLINNARRDGWRFDDNASSLASHWPGKAPGLALYTNSTSLLPCV